MQHEKSASKKAHGEPRSSRKAEKPKSEARAGGHVTAWLARFFVLRGRVSPPQLTGYLGNWRLTTAFWH